eukprot:1317033-Amorphochlora_amoeboformis.AAC.1
MSLFTLSLTLTLTSKGQSFRWRINPNPNLKSTSHPNKSSETRRTSRPLSNKGSESLKTSRNQPNKGSETPGTGGGHVVGEDGKKREFEAEFVDFTGVVGDE